MSHALGLLPQYTYIQIIIIQIHRLRLIDTKRLLLFRLSHTGGICGFRDQRQKIFTVRFIASEFFGSTNPYVLLFGGFLVFMNGVTYLAG